MRCCRHGRDAGEDGGLQEAAVSVVQIHYMPNARIWMGEDMYFCKLAKANGYQIWIDHGLSNEVGHSGNFVYLHEHTADEAQKDDLADAARRIEEAAE